LSTHAAKAPSRVTSAPSAAAGIGWLPLALSAYLATRMFMVFQSGLPQPWDIALIVVHLAALRVTALTWVLRNYPLYLGFLGTVLAVNLVWALLRGTVEYAFPIAFQVFNLALFALVASTRVSDAYRFDRAISAGVFAAAAGQFAYWFALEGTSSRAQGSFNNENQLSYWSLCLLGLLLVTRRRAIIEIPAVGLLLWMQMVSTSRAGFVAFSLLIGVWVFEFFRRNPNRYLYLALLAVATLAVVASTSGLGSLNFEVTDAIERRFTKDSSGDEVSLRNTDRISHYPTYAIFGAGEGDLERFPYSLPIEIHSTPMTVLFSYGIFGSVMFWGFLWSLAKQLNWSQRVILVTLILYSITHNGMRFAFFWFLLAVLAAEPALAARRRQSDMASRIAALTKRTSKRSATNRRLPAR
jgi:hypothetical protein